MFLEPARFNRWLRKIGQDVMWQRSHDCPCRDPRSGAPRSECRVCRNGQIWDPPAPGYLGLSGQKANRAWEQSGMWEKGDVVCTLPSNTALYKMSEFDRIVFTQSSIPFSLVRKKAGVAQAPGGGAVGGLYFSDSILLLPDGSADPTAPRLDFGVVTIDRVFWLTPDFDGIVEGDIPTLQPDGSLTWEDGDVIPPQGVEYTISGRKNPEYFCFTEYPQDRAHHAGRDLPRRVVLRLFDLFGRAA